MASGMKTITYPVKDLAAAKQLYGRLFGVEPYMDERCRWQGRRRKAQP
jgi:extradiol dioxygenase family protein